MNPLCSSSSLTPACPLQSHIHPSAHVQTILTLILIIITQDIDFFFSNQFITDSVHRGHNKPFITIYFINVQNVIFSSKKIEFLFFLI